MTAKVGGDAIGLQANGGDAVFRDDDAQGQGIIILVAAEEGDIHQNQNLVILDLDTGFFFFVQCGAQKVHLNAGGSSYFLQFVLRGRHYVQPIAFF